VIAVLVGVVVLLVLCFVVWKKFLARKRVTVSGQQLSGSNTPRMSRGGSYRGVVGSRVDYAKQSAAAAAESAAEDEREMRREAELDDEEEDDTADDGEDGAEEEEQEDQQQQQAQRAPQRQPAGSTQQQQVKRPV
jgi:hypothetical protein